MEETAGEGGGGRDHLSTLIEELVIFTTKASNDFATFNIFHKWRKGSSKNCW